MNEAAQQDKHWESCGNLGHGEALKVLGDYVLMKIWEYSWQPSMHDRIKPETQKLKLEIQFAASSTLITNFKPAFQPHNCVYYHQVDVKWCKCAQCIELMTNLVFKTTLFRTATPGTRIVRQAFVRFGLRMNFFTMIMTCSVVTYFIFSQLGS